MHTPFEHHGAWLVLPADAEPVGRNAGANNDDADKNLARLLVDGEPADQQRPDEQEPGQHDGHLRGPRGEYYIRKSN